MWAASGLRRQVPADAAASQPRKAQVAKELSCYLIGWRGYFGFCETPSVLPSSRMPPDAFGISTRRTGCGL
jgi:hypothetical protein